ncbi:hypothetical protein LG299_14870 [Microbacterium lacus]|uniref:hypothetical protein n=1 Tax=Microbacterium lacus TaxID=415217 RepID=UPI00384AA4E1
MMDASPRPIRSEDARRAWIIGGSLLIVVALIPLIVTNLGPGIFFTGVMSDVAWCAAMVIFAFGIRGAGSVVARNRVGVVALVVAGVAPVVFQMVWAVLPTVTGPTLGVQTLAVVQLLVPGTALVIAGVVIARAGAVTGRLRWAPLIAVCAVSAMYVVLQLVGMAAPTAGQQVLVPLFGLMTLISTAALVAVGVLAIVLAPRKVSDAPSRPVQVYPPSSTN